MTLTRRSALLAPILASPWFANTFHDAGAKSIPRSRVSELDRHLVHSTQFLWAKGDSLLSL